ncbi:MAG: M23 family metallopeptidase [Deltaproteobacteria bacterium]|nr:M23 family metallopeptidase [Deltaproteobacteria bacterium]
MTSYNRLAARATKRKPHIIISGDEGRAKALVLKKNTIYRASLAFLLCTFLLAAGTGLHYFRQNSRLKNKTAALSRQLMATSARLEDIRREKNKLVTTYEKTIAGLQQDQANLLDGSISRLDERSRIIRSVMDRIGVNVRIKEDPGHSGGPLIAPAENYEDRLISRTDRYLDILDKIPLGRPVPGAISSKFGRRIDPLIHKTAFHPGLDFRGRTGDAVHATAAGVVEKAGYSKSLGRYIFLSHGNGYETIFGHLHKILVKKGDIVSRSQVIGEIGNTGRSTGSHLHYGIRYRNKTINPMKYVQVAGLAVTNR